MNWETYLALGDSITIGARSYSGYPELAGRLLEQRLSKQWNVINHSVSGFKAIDLARYIDLHFSTLQTHRASISTILIGTNDIKEKTDPDDFRMALNLVMLKAKMLTVNSNVVALFIPEFQNGIMYPYAVVSGDFKGDYTDALSPKGLFLFKEYNKYLVVLGRFWVIRLSAFLKRFMS